MMLQKPKGILVPIVGIETRTANAGVFKRIIKETGKINPKICLFTLGSEHAEQTELEYRLAFKDLQISDIEIINFIAHTEADSDENLEKVKNADIILFCDGSQLKLSTLLGGTHLIARIKKRYRNETNFVVAGMNAGATILSNTMIVSCGKNDAMLKGELEITNGLNLISSIFIDTHFAERGRFGCLIQTVTFNPALIGVGLSKETAAIIKNEEIEVIGNGLITIVDGTTIGYTDLTEISHGEPITVEGIKLHFLSVGKRYSIAEKQIQKTCENYLLERRA